MNGIVFQKGDHLVLAEPGSDGQGYGMSISTIDEKSALGRKLPIFDLDKPIEQEFQAIGRKNNGRLPYLCPLFRQDGVQAFLKVQRNPDDVITSVRRFLGLKLQNN